MPDKQPAASSCWHFTTLKMQREPPGPSDVFPKASVIEHCFSNKCPQHQVCHRAPHPTPHLWLSPENSAGLLRCRLRQWLGTNAMAH